MKSLLLAFGLALGFAASLAATGDITDAKIRLLSAALLARDQGDTVAARRHLAELMTIAPADATVQRLLAGLDAEPVRKITVSGASVTADEPNAPADQLLREEQERQRDIMVAADAALTDAGRLVAAGERTAALGVLSRARLALPLNAATVPAITRLQNLEREILATAEQTDDSRAEGTEGPEGRSNARPNAPDRSGVAAAPQAVGPPTGDGNRQRTSGTMRREVDEAWLRAAPLAAPPRREESMTAAPPLRKKLARIVIPTVSFSGLPLSRVVNTLSVVSQEFDPDGGDRRGVNIVLLDPTNANPPVNMTVRDMSLDRILTLITDGVGYRYEVQTDTVIVRPRGGPDGLDTEFFSVARATVLRMTGRSEGEGGGRTGGDPLAGGWSATGANLTTGTEGEAIRSFLQRAGVDFDSTPGSTLAFDGSQLIVTHNPRQLERVRTILTRYREVRQVEIEAKFMEVQEGALEELGVQWNVVTKATQRNAGAQAVYATGNGGNRSLNEAFSFSSNTRTLDITAPGSTTLVNNADGSQSPVTTPGINLSLPTAPPTIPGGVSLGAANATLANITGIVGEFDVNALVRALSQKSGTELLSAPRLTVLSGNPATITVAQELRYPQSFGEIQSQVGTGSVSGGGSAGVSITSGTPQEFTTRNVGVELRVTPTVEEDGVSISLDLHPKVTEFEGFVEYGGPSVAISGGTTVTVPPGFYQPIFAVREVSTRVTIWDGATLVMGGLTREDVKKVNDKVPVLGSIPIIGRLFRSKGESTQKRNLLIFVTARLVTPGGGLARSRPAGDAPAALAP